MRYTTDQWPVGRVRRAYLFSAANGEPEPGVALLEDDLHRHLSSSGRVPNAHRLHHADVHAVVILEAIEAGVGEVREVGQ